MVIEAAYAISVISTLFRLAVYVFLEVIPHARIGKRVLPTLYTVFVALTIFQLRSSTVKKETPPDTKAVESKDASDVPPPVPPKTEKVKQYSNLYDFASVVFTLPTTSLRVRIAALVINSLLMLAAIDFVVFPYLDDASDVIFTRVGAVYPDAAKIVVRYPATNTTERKVRIAWRQAALNDASSEDAWQSGPVVDLTSEHDWVSTVKLDGLWPRTLYEYRLQDTEEEVLPYPARPIQFHTFPDPLLHSGSHFRFLATSCITPNFPYTPFYGRRIKGFDLVADSLWPAETLAASPVQSIPASSAAPQTQDAPEDLDPNAPSSASDVLSSATESVAPLMPKPITPEAEPPTEFMIFMGDFIYADVPLYYGDDREAYRRLYRRNYNSDSFRKVYERLPIFHTYDDHEIINNYAGESNDSKPPYPNASDAFRLYNADANFDSTAVDQHYYDFCYGDVAYFVMDTRRYRSPYDTDAGSRTMLGDAQLGALYKWLGKVNDTATFKFIVTSVPFTSLWQHDAQIDSWAAYAYEKTTLLSALQSVPNVILLSGDRHEFAAIEYYTSPPGHTVLEVSTSPLSMFYIPLVRTLRMKSEGIVRRIRKIPASVEAEETEIIEEIPREQVLKYLPLGNHKWSSLEVDTRDPQHPTVHVQVMIDGKEAYKLNIAGKPVNLHPEAALGAFIPQSFRGVLDRFGIKPGSWF